MTSNTKPLAGNNYLSLAVTHLNAPYGELVGVEDLREAISLGSTKSLANRSAAAIISYLFVELEPRIIVLCAQEVGVDTKQVNELYKETLAQALPRVDAWEKATEYML